MGARCRSKAGLSIACHCLHVLQGSAREAEMKWVVLFILACVGVVAIFLIGVWIEGGLHGLGENLNIALAAGLGILLASGLGVGLMALIFYSNRSGMDEDAGRSQQDIDPKSGL